MKADIKIDGKTPIVGFINPGKNPDTDELYSMEELIAFLNNGYIIDAFRGKDDKIIIALKQA